MNREQVGTVLGALAGLALALLSALVLLGLLSSCGRMDLTGLGDPVPLPVRADAGRVPPAADPGADAGTSRAGNEGGTSVRQDADTAGDSAKTGPDLTSSAGGSGGTSLDAGPPPSFQVQASECDPVTGLAPAGGSARCGGGYTCEFACPPRGATARPTCTAEGLDGRSCAGGPCGWTEWSTGGPRRYLACAYGSSCFAPPGAGPGSLLIPAAGGASTRSDGVCRTYCEGDADCYGGTCDHDALPCAPAGTGLCPQGPPRASCERV